MVANVPLFFPLVIRNYITYYFFILQDPSVAFWILRGMNVGLKTCTVLCCEMHGNLRWTFWLLESEVCHFDVLFFPADCCAKSGAYLRDFFFYLKFSVSTVHLENSEWFECCLCRSTSPRLALSFVWSIVGAFLKWTVALNNLLLLTSWSWFFKISPQIPQQNG